MQKKATYAGVDNDKHAGMTSLGKLIRDAKVFGILEDDETCKGWNAAGFDALLAKVNVEWDKVGCMVSQLPKDLFDRHQEIHGKALKEARAVGWTGEYETEEDD